MSDQQPPNFMLSAAKRALLNALLEEERLSSATRKKISKYERNGPVPLSFAQESLWFLYQLEGGNSSYNTPIVLRLDGHLEVGALEKCFNQLVQRHEILRTRFDVIDGQPRQIIADELDIQISAVDLTEIDQDGREDEMQRLVIEAGSVPFDLVRGPLLRIVLYRMSEMDHVLLINLHHSIIDEWSTGVLWRDLGALYRSALRGEMVELPELPIQYADFAIWQREWLEEGAGDEQLAYWKEKLAGAIDTLDMPSDHLRPAVSTSRGAVKSRVLSGKMLQRLRRISRHSQATLFTTLLAAFQVLLFHYARQEDILIGTPIANRRWPEVENLIGFFLNTLVIRADLSGNPSFWELLERTNATVMEVFEHQDLPFERLVEALRPNRDLSRHPLFQVMFVLRPDASQELNLLELEVKPVRIDFGWAKFDLTLYITEAKDELRVSIEYSTDLFEGERMERLLGHFEALLEAIIADPERPVWELSLVTEAEKRQLLVEWNETQASFPRELCVHQLFDAQALRSPDTFAILHGEEHLTYRELESRANQVARYLRDQGIGANKLVGLYLDRSMEMIVGLLGILKAGGAYVPLDPSYPEERISMIFQEAKLPFILTNSGLRQGLPSNSSQVICLDTDWDRIVQQESDAPSWITYPDNLAYVLFTSGSTGVPKGVAMPHQPLCNMIWWQINVDDSFSAPARTLQFTSLNFDVSFQEIFSTLCSGGTLVLISEEIRRDSEAMLLYLQAQSIERLFLPFVALQQLAEAAELSGIIPMHLRDVITAGEQLQTTQAISNFFSQLKGCRLHNHYGPTEAHVVTGLTLKDKPKDWSKLPPIGKPIANTNIYLLGRGLQPVPVGIPGDLYIGGIALARGYLERPQMSADRFIPNPYATSEGERLYKTGDLACYLPDGNIEFLGRLDHQIKVRGYRVELGEIEIALTGHPAVKEAVVIAWERPRQDGSIAEKRLAAYVTTQDGKDINGQDLHTYLKRKLPDYMIPSTFMVLDALPMTPNGKVDRKALPDPTFERADIEEDFLAPRNELERQLCQIWETVLGVQPVGVHDNFFNLGGYSLLAVRLFTRIEQKIGKRLPLALLFQAPTVAELASILQEKEVIADWSTLVPVQVGGSKPPFFCVHNFGGEVLNYEPLAQMLGSEQPFIGLQARGLDGDEEPHHTIPEMATYYLQAMQTLQPNGPYYLGGFCFGGVVAYEMACQLQAQGEEVAMLAVISGSPPIPSPGWSPRKMVHLLRNFPYWLRDFASLGYDEILRSIRRRYRIIRKRIDKRLGKPSEIKPLDLIGEQISNIPVHRQRLMEIHLQALMDYTPPLYKGHVTLFRVRAFPLFTYYEPDMGWERVTTGGVTVRIIQGTHYDALERRHAEYLARELGASLEQARGAA